MNTYKELYYGGIAGSVATLCTHPIDTLKTLRQISNKKIKKNDIFDLYRGLRFPLISNFLLNGSIFLLEQKAFNIVNNHIYSGFIVGLLSSPINNIFELYKIRRQCKIINKFSPFLGFKSTILRDTIGHSIYFGSYYGLSNNLNGENDICKSFVFGGIAGLISWIPTYSIDTIKTRIQTNNFICYKSAINAGGLMNGFKYCSIRCFLYNAIVFTTYESIKKYF
jgi:solute carrier family 25 carnitine/acylcarnitine transporter 20/29